MRLLLYFSVRPTPVIPEIPVNFLKAAELAVPEKKKGDPKTAREEW
jgi:hypothetical protein